MAYAQQALATIDSRLSSGNLDPEVRLNLTDARTHYIIMFENAVKEFSNA